MVGKRRRGSAHRVPSRFFALIPLGLQNDILCWPQSGYCSPGLLSSWRSGEVSEPRRRICWMPDFSGITQLVCRTATPCSVTRVQQTLRKPGASSCRFQGLRVTETRPWPSPLPNDLWLPKGTVSTSPVSYNSLRPSYSVRRTACYSFGISCLTPYTLHLTTYT